MIADDSGDAAHPPRPRPSAGTLVARALALRCPRCGRAPLFRGWFTMHPRCGECGLTFERAPGYYLGSTYINYGLTALVLLVTYVGLHFGLGWSNRELAPYLAAFCVLFPIWAFRYARALWLALDAHFDRSVLDE